MVVAPVSEDDETDPSDLVWTGPQQEEDTLTKSVTYRGSGLTGSLLDCLDQTTLSDVVLKDLLIRGQVST